MNQLFISDLHLHQERPQLTRAFFHFLQTRASAVDELYILGDFFDAWIGDDDDSALAIDVQGQLKLVSAAGVRIFVMHGNRDFLLGQKFAERCGAQLLPEGSIVNVAGQASLLLHGDSLCTKDQDYMKFRAQVRSPEWQKQLLAQPLTARRQLAAQLRAQSQSMNSLKAEDIMDVTQTEVERVMRQAKVTRLIHGHTHRPAWHRFVLDKQPVERIVLGDWHELGWCLSATGVKLDLESWPIPAL